MINSSVQAATITGEVKINANLVGDVSLGKIEVIHSDMPDYEGEYVITPSSEAQILNTKNKAMREDLNVKSIPYYDVANEYGRTIYIGSDINA